MINDPEAMQDPPNCRSLTDEREEYERLTPYSERLEENWGKPWQPQQRWQNLLVFGRHFGNVFVGVQPTFGYEGDPMRLSIPGASPHHGFVPPISRRSGAPTPCSISAPMVPWNSCPANRWA